MPKLVIIREGGWVQESLDVETLVKIVVSSSYSSFPLPFSFLSLPFPSSLSIPPLPCPFISYPFSSFSPLPLPFRPLFLHSPLSSLLSLSSLSHSSPPLLHQWYYTHAAGFAVTRVAAWVF